MDRINWKWFLYNMVRIIAGTLVDVGLGKINPEDIIKIIKSKKGRMLEKHYHHKVYI